MNLQQSVNLQAIVYNLTQDKWYVFFFDAPENNRVLVPEDGGNALQYITTDEQEAEMWLQRFYATYDDFQEIDNTNAETIPPGWAGWKFFGVCFHAER